METGGELHLASLTTGLLGGLAVFLYGMGRMTDALKSAAGPGLRAILQRLTANRWAAALTGALVTAVIQSSSVTTVLVVGFVTAGLMTLTQSIGVILGANVGSTVTAQIVAFHVADWAPAIVAGGFALTAFGRRERLRELGTIVLGLGLLFLGMGLMGAATDPLRDHEPFLAAVRGVSRPLPALVVGALFTALVQSSSATTGIVVAFASQGLLTLEAGIALVLGANVGTCVTAVLATLGRSRAALQAATVHVVFNLVGAALWIGLVPQLAELVRSISPQHPELVGAARRAAEVPREIANAHTLFNVVNALLFLPFAGLLARAVTRWLPEWEAADRARPVHLLDAALDTPSVAIGALRQEVGRLGDLVAEALEEIAGERLTRATRSERFARTARDVEGLYAAILDYGRRLLARSLATRETAELERVLAAANHFLSVADIAAQNLNALLAEWRAGAFRASPETEERFAALGALVRGALVDAVQAVRTDDRALAESVAARKAEVGRAADELLHRLGQRLRGEPERVKVYRLETRAVELLRRVYYFAKRAARTVLVATEGVELDDAA